jgi:hypothetical protein
MPYVPDDAVIGRVEGVMKRDGQFHGSEACARVAAYARHGFEYVLAYIVGDRLQLFRLQATQVCGRVNVV